MFYILLGIIIFLGGFCIVEVVYYNKLQLTISRINEGLNNIDVLLQKKYKLIEKEIDVIRTINKKYKDDPILDEFDSIDIDKIDNFKLNIDLTKMEAELISYSDLDKKLAEHEVIINTNFDLIETNNELNAAKKYYNRNTVLYNRLIKNFPSNIVGLFFKYKVKDFYSEEKIESLEILKK